MKSEDTLGDDLQILRSIDFVQVCLLLDVKKVHLGEMDLNT